MKLRFWISGNKLRGKSPLVLALDALDVPRVHGRVLRKVAEPPSSIDDHTPQLMSETDAADAFEQLISSKVIPQ